jgi:(1->4)-alpha-D-glucan 1-alpha-D-glucosylmutase
MLPLESTYRLQFHKGFTFKDATAITPYLADLGITHAYASPYLKATPGSTHGYDVIDHGVLNPEVGTPAEHAAWGASLTAAGMSHILDTVPNHVGIGTNDNAWFNDVLEHGQASPYANHFDIDWVPPRPQMRGKLLLPVLGEAYGDVLEKGDLKLVREGGKLFVAYYDRRFPISPESAKAVADPAEYNGTPGDARSFDKIDALLNAQHYRLSYWKVASDEINYRRFFDVNSLAALAMERQDVFDAAHRFTFELLRTGGVSGLRIDHPDGLYDPKQYFDRLQAKAASELGRAEPLYVAVEKIIEGDERLPDDWQVSGTSGYDALIAINDLYVDGRSGERFQMIYADLAGDDTPFDEWVYRKKCLVLDTSLSSELNVLAHRLDPLAQANRHSRDFTLKELREGLREMVACFSVYRTYVSAEGVHPNDIAMVEKATKAAIARNPGKSVALFEFVRDTVLQRYPVPEADRGAQLKFAGKFQQVTSPVTAKGIEDTAFYIYNRLTSLNEVGGDPGRFGRDPAAIHAYFADRQANWPLALNPLSTHDTKRSEDVRARISVLSELPDEWAAALGRWAKLNDPKAPTRNDQYLIYQTLIGAWPLDGKIDKTFTDRIHAYLAKALKEAKVNTSWTAPNADYEGAVKSFLDTLLAEGSSFRRDFEPFQKRISHFGMLNSLSQTLVRLMAPGVPDTYQGTELWDFSLVDPDNRRPVDYAARRALLAEVKSADISAASLLATKDDGRIKLLLTHRALLARRDHAGLFTAGSYEPLTATGTFADHLFAFVRRHQGRAALVVAPRLMTAVSPSPADLPVGAKWRDTKLSLPPGLGRLTDVLTGRTVPAAGDVLIADLFAELPLALCVTA